jgi:hypothetical protein
MMLALIIGKIFLSGVPFNIVCILCNFIAHPKISHFHRTRALSFHGVVGDADGRRIVAMDRRMRLGMSQFFERHAENHALFAI